MTLGHWFLGPVAPREVELAPAYGGCSVAVVHKDLFPCQMSWTSLLRGEISSLATTSDAPVGIVFGPFEWQSCQSWYRLSVGIQRMCSMARACFWAKHRMVWTHLFCQSWWPCWPASSLLWAPCHGFSFCLPRYLIKTNLASLAFFFGVFEAWDKMQPVCWDSPPSPFGVEQSGWW